MKYQRHIGSRRASFSREHCVAPRSKTLGSPSRRDFTAIGDTINTAKRLEENAAMGQIIVSEATCELLTTQDGLHFNELGTIQVKGRQQGIEIYEVSAAD